MSLAASIFFFNDTATTEIYTLSLHDALPICVPRPGRWRSGIHSSITSAPARQTQMPVPMPVLRESPWCRTSHGSLPSAERMRSEEHTSELQSRQYLVCRLLLEKKKDTNTTAH